MVNPVTHEVRKEGSFQHEVTSHLPLKAGTDVVEFGRFSDILAFHPVPEALIVAKRGVGIGNHSQDFLWERVVPFKVHSERIGVGQGAPGSRMPGTVNEASITVCDPNLRNTGKTSEHRLVVDLIGEAGPRAKVVVVDDTRPTQTVSTRPFPVIGECARPA